MNHQDGLNERQKEAVLHTSGALLILAGAGAGKTKTVTHRILHLIHSGIAPHQILAITFTNKAAKEMRERVETLIGSDTSLNFPISFGSDAGSERMARREMPFVSTFHSLGVHILKENAGAIGLNRHFSICDRADSKRMVKEAIESRGLNPKQFEPGKILHIISREKGNFVTAERYASAVGNEYMPNIVAEVWQTYESILRREKSLDFDDLLLKTAVLLQNEQIREHYQNIWKYIHIDEYQDTNKVQYTIAKLLAAKHGNICVVGDIDQMIYSWRGADITNILTFEKDYPDAKVVLLEENYRSTQTILHAANIIIKKNKHRREKNLFTNNGLGEKIGVFTAYDETDEAFFIAKKSQELIERGLPAEEIAVLYRANFQSRALEEAFLALDVPYQVLGTRFFERKEVKDVLSYMRAALNPESSSDLKRVINVPARGIGKVGLLKILSNQSESLPTAQKQKYDSFKNLLTKIAEKANSATTSETVKFVIKESGIETMLKQGDEEDEERLENVEELVTLATKYDGLPAPLGTEKLLEEAALQTDQDSLEKNERAVKLMTVHASKGLEFDYVFISGLEQDLFPHRRDGDTESDAEEERRLFYVAVTRARKKVYLSNAGIRTIFGGKQVNVPSEFIIDIDEELLEPEERLGEELGKRHKTIYFD